MSGQRWITADVALAPLAPGDYIIEIGTIGTQASRASSPASGSSAEPDFLDAIRVGLQLRQPRRRVAEAIELDAHAVHQRQVQAARLASASPLSR